MATYTHYTGEMVSDTETPELSPLFFYWNTTLIVEESNSTQLVFSYTPTVGGESGKIYVYGAGFTDFNPANISAMADSVTGLARYDSSGHLRDTITDFNFDNGGEQFAVNAGSVDFYFAGNDTFNGAAISDNMDAGDGDDTLFGNGGNDNIVGGAGNDIIHGGVGDDRVVGGGSNGSATSDRVYGDSGNDDVQGSQGDDFLYGGSGADTLRGFDGNDSLNGGAGTDTMRGGFGDDTYYVDNSADKVIDDDGFDRVVTTVSYYSNNLSIEVLDARNAAAGVALTANIDYGLRMYGSGHDDIITGSNEVDVLNGREGADTMTGYDGSDKYYVDNALDVVVEDDAGSGAADAIYAEMNFILADDQFIEFLYANAGSDGLALTGNSFANKIYGNSGGDALDGAGGNDTLRGQGGADRLVGGAGVDSLYGGADADTFVLQRLTANRDVIRDFVHGGDKLEASETVFGELDGVVAFADRFLANGDGLATSGGNSDTRFIYNSTTGQLYFDPDGTGAAVGKLIAQLADMPALDSTDFVIV